VSELGSLKDLSLNGPKIKTKIMNFETLSMSTPLNDFELA
jgi:hypothetical protein